MRFHSAPLLSAALLLLATIDSNERRSNVAHAQVSVPGSFLANYAGTFYNEASLNIQDLSVIDDNLKLIERTKIQGPPPVLRLPHLDNAHLLDEEKTQHAELLEQGMEPDGAYQFGKAISVESFDSSSTLSRGRWIPLKLLRQQQQPKAMQRHSRYASVDEDDVMVWQLEIHSKSALSLNLIFSDFHIPKGSEFYVSGKKHVLGAFTAEVNNKPDGVFATAPISGDKLLLEFYTPKGLLKQGILPRIQLSHIIHGYKPTLLASSSDITSKGIREQDGTIKPASRRDIRFRDQSSAEFGMWPIFESNEDPPVRAMSGKCNVDVACHQTKYFEQSRSVGVILTNYNQKYCTGALVNNVRQDGKQLFLTANHCSGYSDTTEHIVMFNHEKVLCGPNSEEINEHDTAMGLVKLGNYASSDYVLYEIIEPIPDAYNVYLAGWSALPIAPASRISETPSDTPPSDGDNDDEPTKSPWRTSRVKINNGKKDPQPAPPTPQPPSNQLPIVGIHHPSGDSKKISFYYNGTLPKACWSECDADESYYHWQIPRWDIGTTEPGSSGSPLFDADKRIVGQLHGGSASCWNKEGYDVYGAIHASFDKAPKKKNHLSTYLDPDETGAKFMDGYSLEKARRESKERQRDEGNNRQVDYGYDAAEPIVVEPLGRLGLEKPLTGTRAKQPCHSTEEIEENVAEKKSYFEKTPRFSRLWQKLMNELRDYAEY